MEGQYRSVRPPCLSGPDIHSLTLFVLVQEYAGEIRDFYPSTKVTIVHNRSMLLNDAYPVKYRRRLEHDARARGIDIVFDDRIDVLEPSTESTVTTRKEKTIPCDLIVRTDDNIFISQYVCTNGGY